MALSEGLEFGYDLDITLDPFQYYLFIALDVLLCIKVLPLLEKFRFLCFEIPCVDKASYVNDQIFFFCICPCNICFFLYPPCNNRCIILFIIYLSLFVGTIAL